MRQPWAGMLVVALLAGLAVPVGAAELARIEAVGAGEVQVKSFVLERPGRVILEARAAVGSSGDGERISAWLLDGESRRPVWVLDEDDADDKDRKTFELTTELSLAAGRYELYGAAAPDNNHLDDVPMVGTALRMLAGVDSYRTQVDTLLVAIEGAGRAESPATRDGAVDRRRDDLLIDFSRLGDEERLRRGFRLLAAATVEVRASGEITRSGRYDYGWIADAESGEVVWELTLEGSEPAGGAIKNRFAIERLELPAGRYIAGVASDGSHSFAEWNAVPPYDPSHWGLSIRALTAVESEPFDADELFERQVLAAMVEVGDGEQRELSFQLTADSVLRVVALGEGAGRSMYDYGWIVDQVSGEKVWEMTYEATGGAGGARKNRRVDELVPLSAGAYTAYYVSDGSHSFDAWNATAPAQPELWGLTLMAPTVDFDRGRFRRLAEAVGGEPLARLERMQSGVRSSRDFSLERETEVIVSALGEGAGGRMYDYGWIENRDSGERVWEMSYEDTEAAGGASKNRRLERRLSLPAGNYSLYFETDGSHAYGDWNADPPARPDAWGIRLSLASP